MSPHPLGFIMRPSCLVCHAPLKWVTGLVLDYRHSGDSPASDEGFLKWKRFLTIY